MANKSKNAKAGWRVYSGLIVVCLIVIGVAILSVTASKTKPSSISSQPAQAPAPTTSGKGPAFLILSSDSLKLMSLDGSRELKIVWPDDVSRLGKPLSQIRGVDLGTGQPVWLDSGFVRASSTAWRSPDGRRSAYLASDRRDGSGAVEIKQGNESTLLVLRQKSGRKITDEQLLGWLDKDTLALAAVATSTRNILILDLNGTLTPIANLPDDAWLIKVADGAIYYARATPGEGIEMSQSPPSSLWKIVPGKGIEEIAEESSHVIQNFVVSEGMVVYATEDNNMTQIANDGLKSLGKGLPMLYINGQGTLIIQNSKLVLIKNDGQTSELSNVSMKGAIFYLPEASLDEKSSN
ncbi:MAG: hypothetical protein PHC53_02240 [Patescibacteria group bacterium]|nr:hypothetical protein [Patescibacteria group bacterium]